MLGPSKSDFGSFARYGLGGFIPSRYRQNAAPQQDKALQAVVIKLCEAHKNSYSRAIRNDSEKEAALIDKISILQKEKNQSQKVHDAQTQILGSWRQSENTNPNNLHEIIQGLKNLQSVPKEMKDELIHIIEDRIKVVAGFEPWKGVMEKWNIRLDSGSIDYSKVNCDFPIELESDKMKAFILRLRTEVVEPFCKPVKDYRGISVTPESFDLKIKYQQKKLNNLQESKGSRTSSYEQFQKAIKQAMSLFGRKNSRFNTSHFSNKIFGKSSLFSRAT